jgi:CRISPR-associated protein Cas1
VSEGGSSSLLPVEALHALVYCERLFYLEYVEGIQLASARVYAGRTLHEDIEREAGLERVEVSDEGLGLVGAVDAIRHADGTLIPYEHKRGRARRMPDGRYDAWPSDKVQVAAYALLIEAATGRKVIQGRIRYHADEVTVSVAVDEDLRREVLQSVARARELATSLDRPPVTSNENLCVHCSLAPVCLPEEERSAAREGSGKERDVLRLFPQEEEGAVVHVTRPGARVGRSGDRLVVDMGEESQEFPIRRVQSLALHGQVRVSPSAIGLCVAGQVPVHWFTAGGRYLGTLSHALGAPQRRIRQYRAVTDERIRMRLCRTLVEAKVSNTRRYLLRVTRGRREGEIRIALERLADIERMVPGAESAETLRGLEGEAARLYFGVLPLLLESSVPGELRPDGRTRRPPKDRFNALLSFFYGLLERSCMEAVVSVGLDPTLGFFHTPRSAAPPLVLDLMEMFRLPVCDVAVLGAVNRHAFDPATDFEVTKERVWLSASGRRKAIGAYERRLEETWRHPVVNYSLSWKRLIELEVRLLEKEWSGTPGLFGRLRMR